jgi:uncharacterized protein (DUF1684 family)
MHMRSELECTPPTSNGLLRHRGKIAAIVTALDCSGIHFVRLRIMLKLSVLKLSVVILALGFAWAPTTSAEVTTIGPCEHDYEQCLNRWKQDRLEFLKSDIGYLNLAGLYWLNEGQNSFGSGSSNDLVFPAKAAPLIGTFDLRDGAVSLSVNVDTDVRHLDRPIQQIIMAGASVHEPIVVRHDSYAWNIIERDGTFAVRLRDYENPVLTNFPKIDYFPTSNTNRVSGVLRRYEEPRVIRVDTVVEGLDYNPWSPGVVEFEIDGKTFDLEAYDAGNELFFVFGDQTTGRETYPAGRFLYATKPGTDGIIELDFNTAHSPPCAYNDFATCPVASPRNRIAVRIAAGERYERTRH